MTREELDSFLSKYNLSIGETRTFYHKEILAHDQAQREEIARLREALKHWLHTYAWDMCDEKDVAASRVFIQEHGGTLAYIAGLLHDRKHQATLAENRSNG